MNRIQWERKVPVYKNRFIRKGIFFSIGIPLIGMLALVCVLLKWHLIGADAKYIFGMIGVFYFLCTLLALMLFGSRYAPGFLIDDEGIVNFYEKKPVKAGAFITFFLLTFGLSKGACQTAVSDGTPQTHRVRKIEWKDIRKVRYYPKQYVVLVRGGLTESIAIFCTKDNYDAVVKKIREKRVLYPKI